MNKQSEIVEASEARISINTAADVSDALAACFGARGMILTESNLAPEFFDLRTGLAGELLQKFTNYKKRLAVVVPNPHSYGERFAELVLEHRRHNLIRFVRSRDEAIAWLVED